MVLPKNDVVRPVVSPIGHRPQGSPTPYADYYNRYHFALGGVPFMSAASQSDPMIRRTATFRKQQFDASNQPGEQSLTGWWLRSQATFHYGAGLAFVDPALDETAILRYADSEGVDVWTEGYVTMLPDTTLQFTSPQPSAPMYCVGAALSGGTDIVAWANGTACGITTTSASYTFTYDTAPTTNFMSMASDGASIYMASLDGVWQAVLPANPGTVQAKKLWQYSASTAVVLGWAKGRLMLGIDKALYDLAVPGGSQPFALPSTAVFTSRVTGWIWSSIAAGPDKIYVSGYAGNRGSILALALDTSGLLPTLSGATEVAQLPTGEWPLVVRGYLGTFLAIGTNKGFRIAQVSTAGDIQYGPLVRTKNPVRDLVGRDKFVYGTISGEFSDGSSGLMRIDLSITLPDGRQPYSKDLKAATTGTAHNVANIGNSDSMAFTVDGQGLYFQSATQLTASGYLLTGKIRYDTSFPKLFKQFSIKGSVQGNLTLSTVDVNNTAVSIVSVSSTTDLSQDFQINYPDQPQEYLAFRLDFARNSTNLLLGPSFRGYQVKALPAGPRPRQFVIPVLCFDNETDKDGVASGYPGFGFERLAAVEQLDSSGAVILFEDLLNKRSWLVQIDQIEFRQQDRPGKRKESWGGVLNLVLRTIN